MQQERVQSPRCDPPRCKETKNFPSNAGRSPGTLQARVSRNMEWDEKCLDVRAL